MKSLARLGNEGYNHYRLFHNRVRECIDKLLWWRRLVCGLGKEGSLCVGPS